MISFYINCPKLSTKNCFISCHKMMLLKYLRQLKTMVSYYGSSVAFEHRSQISLENPFIDSSTSSLYLFAYKRIDSKAAPLHLNIV